MEVSLQEEDQTKETPFLYALKKHSTPDRRLTCELPRRHSRVRHNKLLISLRK